jgi:hypothetical protein
MTNAAEVLERHRPDDAPPALPLPRRKPRPRNVITIGIVAVLLGFVAFVGYWAATGGRWYVVQTPSMGTAAPVGTLLWVEPVQMKDLHVGDFITFRPAGSDSTYSHRVYTINADSTISTKGQITAPDPWTLRECDIVGKVQMRWWGMGWLVKAVPILVIGGLVLWLVIRRFSTHRWRLPLTVAGGALLICVSIVMLRPLTRADQISSVATSDGARATYISTGLLPLRLQAAHGDHVNLRNGQLGSVVSTQPDSAGHYPITLNPDIIWWWWLVLVAACFVPALWTVFFGQPSRSAPKHRAVPTTA